MLPSLLSLGSSLTALPLCSLLSSSRPCPPLSPWSSRSANLCVSHSYQCVHHATSVDQRGEDLLIPLLSCDYKVLLHHLPFQCGVYMLTHMMTFLLISLEQTQVFSKELSRAAALSKFLTIKLLESTDQTRGCHPCV